MYFYFRFCPSFFDYRFRVQKYKLFLTRQNLVQIQFNFFVPLQNISILSKLDNSNELLEKIGNSKNY